MPFLPSIQPVFEKAPPFLPGQMATPISAPLSSTVRINQKSNVDGPDHAFQVNETLLYEHEFHGQSYVSCHLQRLQHGIFSSDSLHAKSPLHISFVAVTFTFHPALSIAHRFTSAVIEITARDDSHQPLRFVKFAPHLAYGRISSESLKWSFQLGAALGVTQGPVNLSVNPTGKYETEKVIGTMMKIQGSTRSSHDSHHKRIADTKLVWFLAPGRRPIRSPTRTLRLQTATSRTVLQNTATLMGRCQVVIPIIPPVSLLLPLRIEKLIGVLVSITTRFSDQCILALR
jgi:hypothetical protein